MNGEEMHQIGMACVTELGIRKYNAEAHLGIGFENNDSREGLGRDIFRVRGLRVNEINWGNIWKKRIDGNVKQKVSLWEGAMEGKFSLRWYENKPKPGREFL